MSLVSKFSKLVLPFGSVFFAGMTMSTTPATNSKRMEPVSDSTMSVSIEVFNKHQLPIVTAEKEVAIPEGYAYVEHTLSLVSAFPVEGTTQSANRIIGPNNSWSIYAERANNRKESERVILRASAAPGRKNEEIGVKAIVSIELRRTGSTN